MKKGKSFQQIVLDQLDIHMGNLEHQSLISLSTKINSKWMTDSSKESNYKISRRKQNFCELGLDMYGLRVCVHQGLRSSRVTAMFSIIKSV